MSAATLTVPATTLVAEPMKEIKVDFGKVKKSIPRHSERVMLLMWYISLAVTQLWSDLWERRHALWNMSFSDFTTRLIYLPIGRGTPRLVTNGPYEHLDVFDIARNEAPRYEEHDTVFTRKTRQIINCASNNYAGFSRLEGDAEALVEHTIKRLPFAPGPPELEETLKEELRKYMGFEACGFMPSGFSSNLLAFRTVHQYAQSRDKACIFLCDRDCHNSLLSGAFCNSRDNAAAYKFNHNDITDLELQLQALKQQQPRALVCVVVEGIYSLEGLSAPIPAILALRKVYNFTLLVDEAHSFLSLGNSGRGSFEHWEDLGYTCPLTECDIMTCMFSKSAGCTGGMVLARGDLAAQLNIQVQETYSRGSERLATGILVRLLDIFRKPELIQYRCALVKRKGLYAAAFLKRAGYTVLSFPGSPIICYSVGSLRQLAHYQTEVQRRGLAIAFAGPPATPLWASRARMSIFATLPWADLYTALSTLVDAGVYKGVPGVKRISHDPEQSPRDESSAEIEQNYKSVDKELFGLVDTLAEKYSLPTDVGSHWAVIDSARIALNKYGIGPCSARWFYGSFDSYVHLEQRLARAYPSLIAHSGICRAMVCGDADVTIGSSFAARASVKLYNKSTNLVLVSHSAPHFVQESLNVTKASKARPIVYYDTVTELPGLLTQGILGTKPDIVTIYLDVVDADGKPIDIIPLLKTLSRLSTSQLKKACIFLNDCRGLNKLGPQRLGYLNHLEKQHGPKVFAEHLGRRASHVEILVAGSWYTSFGHQGGYVVGASTVVESLTWNSRAYFFSTPPMPMQTVMSNKAFQLLQEGAGQRQLPFAS